MHTFERRTLPTIDLEYDLLCAVEPGLVVADRGGRNKRAIGANAGDFDNRGIKGAEKALPGHGRDLRKMHIEVFHFASVDLFAGVWIRVVGQSKLDAVHSGERAVEFGTGGGASPDTKMERIAPRMLCFDLGRKCKRY